MAKEIKLNSRPVTIPAAVIGGGETTVTLQGDGRGGRNQEFALSAAMALKDMRGTVLLCGGTDGTDGPTDAAGAFSDTSTLKRAGEMGIDPYQYLFNNDAYHFFQKLGDLFKTGPTNTNVMDIHLVLVR